jgi:acetyl esterase/lipase
MYTGKARCLRRKLPLSVWQNWSRIFTGLIFVLVVAGIVAKIWQPQEIPASQDLKYGPLPINTLDLYYPAGGKAPYPLIVWIHGGAWHHGDKRPLQCHTALEHGYAVAGVNYRLSIEATYPAQIEDCKMAIAWLRQHAKDLKIDPDRIGVWGYSSGGELAALLDTTSDGAAVSWAKGNASSVRAVCDWAGPVNLGDLDDTKIARFVALLLGHPPKSVPELIKEAYPATYANKDDPPILIVHGDQDEEVPCRQAQELATKLKEKGVDCTLIIVPNGTHNLFRPKNVERTIKFFDRTLQAKP